MKRWMFVAALLLSSCGNGEGENIGVDERPTVEGCVPGSFEDVACEPAETRRRVCGSDSRWRAFGSCERRGWIPMTSSLSVGFAGREDAAATWTGREMIVFGGNALDPVHDVAAYRPDLDAWKLLPRAPLPPLYRPHVAYAAGKVIVATATTGALLDLATFTWSPLPTSEAIVGAIARPVFAHSTRELVVCPERGTNGALRCGAFSLATSTWRVTSSAPSTLQRVSHLEWVGERVAVLEGLGRTGALYDPKTDTWIEFFPELQWFETEPEVAVHQDELTLRVPLARAPDLFTIDVWSRAWQRLPVPSDPRTAGRRGAAFLWVGDRLWLWGGTVDSELTDDGMWLDPRTELWKSIPTGGPSKRADMVAVWTGREVILWGGRGEDTDRGALYRP